MQHCFTPIVGARVLGPLGLAVLAVPAVAQSNVDPSHNVCWQENAGWINWRDAGSPAGAQGVGVVGTLFRGFAWSENTGFIDFGSGAPVNGTAYSNTTGADHGVNILPGGDLSGLAWGENIGWINFGTAPFVPAAQRARMDGSAGRIRGWAWSENLGWLNLDDALAFVAVVGACYANCDQSTVAPILNVADFTCFLQKFASADPYANCDASTTVPTLNVADFTCFLQRFAAGCP